MVKRTAEETRALLDTIKARGDPFGIATDPELLVVGVDAALNKFVESQADEDLCLWIDTFLSAIVLGVPLESLRDHMVSLVLMLRARAKSARTKASVVAK